MKKKNSVSLYVPMKGSQIPRDAISNRSEQQAAIDGIRSEALVRYSDALQLQEQGFIGTALPATRLPM